MATQEEIDAAYEAYAALANDPTTPRGVENDAYVKYKALANSPALAPKVVEERAYEAPYTTSWR